MLFRQAIEPCSRITSASTTLLKRYHDTNPKTAISSIVWIFLFCGICRDHGRKRARPIIMTTLAMGAGMLPIAAAWGGADMSFRSPMAVAVIGGLITSTVLSLLVVPAVFTYIDDLTQKLGRLWGRRAGEKAGHSPG